MQQRWYVAQLKSGRERVAIRGLKDQGFDSFYPHMRTTRALHGRVIEVSEPVFPSYLFLRSEAENRERFQSIRYTRGVSRLLGNNEPCPIPHGEVERLQEREAQGLLCHAKRRPIRQGDLVEFRCGTFVGLTGVCQWTKRERIGVLLQILGGDTVATSPRDWLKLAVA